MLLTRAGIIAAAGFAPAPTLYAPNAVVFNGANYLSFGTQLAGASNGQLFSAALAIKRTALATGFPRIAGGQTAATAFQSRWSIGFHGSSHATLPNRFFVELRDSANTVILYMVSSVALTALNTWYRIGISAKISATQSFQLRVDNVERASVTTTPATSAIANFAVPNTSIGARLATTPDGFLAAEIADLAVYFDRAINWADSAQWEKFFEPSGTFCLKDKGTSGSVPYGTSPIMFMAGTTASWPVNKGSGGGTYTVTGGALGTSGSPPCGAPIPEIGGNDIVGFSIDTSSDTFRAEGSDNWPTTWLSAAQGGHQLTAGGDGAGFNPNPANLLEGRTPLFVSRITGDLPSITTANVWGGLNPENAATVEGKSYGIVAVGNTVYMAIGEQPEWPSNTGKQFLNAQLFKSTNSGASWTNTGVAWNPSALSGAFSLPNFLCCGQANAAAFDGYIYMFASGEKVLASASGTVFTPHHSQHLYLARVLVANIETQAAWEYYTGTGPTWSTNIANRVPVPGCSGTSSSDRVVSWATCTAYIPGIDRCLYFRNRAENTDGSEDGVTNLEILTAQRPWGPWTRVELFNTWRPFGSSGSNQYNFTFYLPPKWIGARSGNTIPVKLVYSGSRPPTLGLRFDAWQCTSATIQLGGAASLALEPVSGSAAQIAINVGSAERQTWEGYGWGVGNASDANTVAPLLNAGTADANARTQALFADLNCKILRLNNAESTNFISLHLPLIEHAINQGVDRILCTGYIWQSNAETDLGLWTTRNEEVVHSTAQAIDAAISGGIPITHVTYQNEPDAGDGTNDPPDGFEPHVRTDLTALRAALNARVRTAAVKVLGCEWAHYADPQATTEYDLLVGAPQNLVANGTVAHGAGHIYADGPAPDIYDQRWGSTTAGRIAGIWSCETGNGGSPHSQARSLSGLNNGVSAEIFHQGHAEPGGGDDDLSQKLLSSNGTKQPYWGAMSVLFRDLTRGAIFRLCTSSDRPAGLAIQAADKMYRREQGALSSATNVYPRIQIAAAKRPDASWIILGVNSTDGAGSTAGLAACYPAATLQMTVTMPSGQVTIPTAVLQTRRATKAGVISEGTVNMVDGVVRFTLAPGETISLMGGS